MSKKSVIDLNQVAINDIYASIDEDANQETEDKESSRWGRLVDREAPMPDVKKSLSMIMEDKSKHFNVSEGLRVPDKKKSENQAKSHTGRKHSVTQNVHSGPDEGFELRSFAGLANQKRHPGHFDIASISTLGNVSRQIPSNAPGASSPHDSARKEKSEPNAPHPLLEVPPLYWMFKHYPGVLESIKSFYRLRWWLSHPLQKRVCFSQYLRRRDIYMTWGELILVTPLLLSIVGGVFYSFVDPNVELSGHAARLALIFALLTPVRNSIFTFLIGLPFERALWYHKLAGRLAFLLGLLHTYVAHADSVQKAFLQFLSLNQMNASGTGLALLIFTVTVTSVQHIRRWCFEAFYYTHIICVFLMTACAFYHSGMLIPILAILWVGDLVCRKVIMACYRYPRKARIRVVSDSVVEVTFPKVKGFDYNAGQHISICIPQIDMSAHPFSIATCPRMSNVSVLIRKAGNWTRALHHLASEQKEVSILVEGPNGSPNIDIFDMKRYQSVLLLSGGIGVTPIQSICNQLIYEHSKGLRDLKKIRVVWTDRDPVLVKDADVVRRNSSHHLQIPPKDVEINDLQSLASGSLYWDNQSFATDMASALLSHFPPSRQSDQELEEAYEVPFDESPAPSRRQKPASVAEASRPRSAADDSTFRDAFRDPAVSKVLELQVYLTSRQPSNNVLPGLEHLPFIHFGRPDIPKIFADMREDALESGLTRVAVFVCAPARLALICQNACVQFSDDTLQFDVHLEYQD